MQFTLLTQSSLDTCYILALFCWINLHNLFVVVDGPLQNIIWRYHINASYPKPRLRFVQTYVCKVGLKDSNKVPGILNMLDSLSQNVQVKRVVIFYPKYEFLEAKTEPNYNVFYPVFELQILKSNLDVYAGIDVMFPFIWKLQLNKNLRLRLIINELRIFSTLYTTCLHNLTMKSETFKNILEIFVFCGVYHNFDFYSPRL